MSRTIIQSSGNAVQMCGPSTGHVVRNVAFCENEEIAENIADAINGCSVLTVALRNLADAIAGHAGFAPEFKRLIGDDAWNELVQRIHDARSALSSSNGGEQG